MDPSIEYEGKRLLGYFHHFSLHFWCPMREYGCNYALMSFDRGVDRDSNDISGRGQYQVLQIWARVPGVTRGWRGVSASVVHGNSVIVCFPLINVYWHIIFALKCKQAHEIKEMYQEKGQ